MNAKARIDQLTAELKEHNYRYYVLAEPTISDYDFDMMLKELEELEAKHPCATASRLPYPAGGRRCHQGLCDFCASQAHDESVKQLLAG
jgi:NAD-dependent DNA ligase